MTRPATVDREQLAALQVLRVRFGDVEVLAVHPSPPLPPLPPVQDSLLTQVTGGAPASTCKCHASDLYASLWRCPGCGHRSYDSIALSCERRRCAYEGPPATTRS